MSIVLHGVAAGKGIAVGHAHLITRGTAEVPQYDVSDDLIDAEAARFDAAIKATRKELEQLRSAIPENAPTDANKTCCKSSAASTTTSSAKVTT